MFGFTVLDLLYSFDQIWSLNFEFIRSIKCCPPYPSFPPACINFPAIQEWYSPIALKNVDFFYKFSSRQIAFRKNLLIFILLEIQIDIELFKMHMRRSFRVRRDGLPLISIYWFLTNKCFFTLNFSSKSCLESQVEYFF